MKERPILMSAPMVRAIGAGTKTQTRRPIKPAPIAVESPDAPLWGWRSKGTNFVLNEATARVVWPELCPYISQFDKADRRLWVREAWSTLALFDKVAPRDLDLRGVGSIRYAADALRCPDGQQSGKARSPIHMPRWASRLTLEITQVRVQRLHEISEEDAIAEGCQMEADFPMQQPHLSGIGEIGWDDAREWFAWLWDSINGEDAWDENPWVWALSFEVVR